MEIELFQLDPAFDLTEKQIKEIVLNVCSEIKLQARSCTFIFVDDVILAEMHGRYLNDPSPTDVITFDLGDNAIEGEIYISSERALAQAKQYSVSYREEITRLIAHGLLHLAGYNDIDETERAKMKAAENLLVERFVPNP